MKDNSMHFPYYSLRTYDRIYNEGPYKLITTYYGTYVLDLVSRSKPLLKDRRLELCLYHDLPYKIYNLEKRCDHIAQMLVENNNVFLDCYGDIKKVRKLKRYKLLCCPVLSAVELGYKKFGLSFLLNNTVEYFVHHEVTPYIQVLLLKTGWMFYATTHQLVPDTIRGL